MNPVKTATQKQSDTVVVPPTFYGYYGNVDVNSPNRLYKRYLKWFAEKYGTSKMPLSFRNWIKWAKTRGVINADGETSEEQKEEIKKAMSVDRKIAIAALFVTTIGVIVAIARS